MRPNTATNDTVVQQLKVLLDQLQTNWFTQSREVIQAFERQAENNPQAVLQHEYLARYFHLAGDYERAAFYAVHSDPMMDLSDKSLFSQAITQAVLDFYIYKHGGGMNGSCISRPDQTIILDPTKTLNQSAKIYQTQITSPGLSKPFVTFQLMESLDMNKIKMIIEQIINISSPESILSFKVHVKQLQEADLQKMSDEHLKIVKTDVISHDDQEYKRQILKQISHLYLTRNNIKEAVQTIIETNDSEAAANFLLHFILESKTNLAIQTAFDFYDKLSTNLVTKIQYLLMQHRSKSQLIQIISDDILSGKITTKLYLDFMQQNSRIDAPAIRTLGKSTTNSESISACFMMHSLMAMSSMQYEHKESVASKLEKYPLFGLYSQIGLFFRGHQEISRTYQNLQENMGSSDPYALGGSIFGLALQFVGMSNSDSSVLANLITIADEVGNLPEEKRPPVLHGLALAFGLMSLGQKTTEISEILFNNLGNVCDCNYALILGIGLINFGNTDFLETEMCSSIMEYLCSEHLKEREAAGIALALLCFRQESKVQPLLEKLQEANETNQTRFSNQTVQYEALAIALAYYKTNNVEMCQVLLEKAAQMSRQSGAQLCIASLGLVLSQSNHAFQLLSMCTRSFDSYVRAGACQAIGQVFANSANAKVVELLCKMMAEQEEIVKVNAIVAQAFVLQSICGVELPDVMKIEYNEPVGDRQKNCLYKCDYKDDESFERAKNQQKLYNHGNLQDRYKDNYKSRIEHQLSLQQYVTQFRRDLIKLDEQKLLTQRATMLALGIINAGGLNLSFKLESDLQVASYVLFLQSFNWYPMMGVLGLCMAPDFMSCVEFSDDQLIDAQVNVYIPTDMYKKYGYSVMSKQVSTSELSMYVQKARLSSQDLKDQKMSENRFKFMKQVRNIAIDEFTKQANNVKLNEILDTKVDKNKETEEEMKIMETPVRIVDEMVDSVKFITGMGYRAVTCVKRGVCVVEQCDEEE